MGSSEVIPKSSHNFSIPSISIYELLPAYTLNRDLSSSEGLWPPFGIDACGTYDGLGSGGG